MKSTRIIALFACASCGLGSHALAQCGRWVVMAPCDRQVNAALSWDHDDDDLTPPVLVVGGSFGRIIGHGSIARIAQWNGASWESLGPADPGHVQALTTWDPDGEGPEPRRLVAGGSAEFDGTGGLVRTWDGTQWTVLGNLDREVLALHAWDPDGPGGEPEQLFAGGYFTTTQADEVVSLESIARWDGAAWRPLGPGLGSFSHVEAIIEWDTDGSGPLPESLLVAGQFTTFDGAPAEYLATWDGAAWSPFPTSLSSEVSAAAVDRSGGEEVLFIAGYAGYDVRRWDGDSLQPLAGLDGGQVWDMVLWDFDGAGPLAPQLIAGGEFHSPDGLDHIARWDGQAWRSVGYIPQEVFDLTVWDRDGAGPEPASLVAVGAFGASGLATVYTPCCPADLDANATVDVFDLLAYLDLWFAGDAAAERTGDEPAVVDVFDLLMYLDEWFGEC